MIPDLNTKEIKIVIQNFLWNIVGISRKPRFSDIKFNKKEQRLYLYGKGFLTYSRHHHYPNTKDHPVAVYFFLKTVEEMVDRIGEKIEVKDV